MTLDEYERQLCAQAGWPATPATLAVMSWWNHLEGGDNPDGLALQRGWNIWMTTWPNGPDTPRSKEDIGWGPGKWNNANPPLGVGIYANAAAGITATIKTIRGDARFAVIDRMFTQSVYVEGFRSAIGTWIGDPGYSDNLDAFAREQYGAAPAAEEEDQVTRREFEDLCLAFASGSEEKDDKGNLRPRDYRLTAAYYRIGEIAAGREPSLRERVTSQPPATMKPHNHRLVALTGGPLEVTA